MLSAIHTLSRARSSSRGVGLQLHPRISCGQPQLIEHCLQVINQTSYPFELIHDMLFVFSLQLSQPRSRQPFFLLRRMY